MCTHTKQLSDVHTIAHWGSRRLGMLSLRGCTLGSYKELCSRQGRTWGEVEAVTGVCKNGWGHSPAPAYCWRPIVRRPCGGNTDPSVASTKCLNPQTPKQPNSRRTRPIVLLEHGAHHLAPLPGPFRGRPNCDAMEEA